MEQSRASASTSLANISYSSGDFCLVPIREQDIESIRIWRNSQVGVLRQTNQISPEQQKKYFSEYFANTASSAKPASVLYSLILRQANFVAYGGVVHIEWDSGIAELSFLASNEIADIRPLYDKVFGVFLELIEKVAFVDLGLKLIFTETFPFRVEHIRILESYGYETNCPGLDELHGERFKSTSVYHGKVTHLRRDK